MKLNKKIWAATILGSLIAGGAIAYPHVLRSQVEKRIPGIEFQDVSLGFSGVTLTNVKVDKGWIKGSIDSVVSDFEGKQVLLDGGNLAVNLDDRPKEKASQTEETKRDIQFQGLQIALTYQQHNLKLEDVHSNGTQICFVKAKSEAPAVTAINGCVEKESKIVGVEEAKLKELEFMGARVTDLLARKITVNLKQKTAEVEFIRTNLLFEKQTFAIQATGAKGSKNPEKIHLDSVKVLHPWLATDWSVLKKVEVQHTDKWNLSFGSSQVEVQPDTFSVSGSEDCNTWIDSLPDNLKTSPLNQISMTGKTSFAVSFRPKPSFSLKADCKAVCSTLPNLRKGFHYTAYSPKGEAFERDSGLGTKGWLSIKAMGDMPLAATTMEDPGFEKHRGFITQAFANSLVDNLKEGKFLRGGSTITMQLAKNLWLTRDKTLGRKVQEFFLAQAIESCYSKDEILEFYLNVVEFGPNKYGVSAGAQHWFHKTPDALLPAEAFWLASILPRPNKTNPPDEQSLHRIEKLMKKLSTDGRIPDLIIDTDNLNFDEE